VDDLAKSNSNIPKFIVSGLFNLISKTIKEKVKFNIYDLNPLVNDAPNISVPGFFIVGKDDELVPCEHTKLLYQAYKSAHKEIRIVVG
jgi:esterase/lipase